MKKSGKILTILILFMLVCSPIIVNGKEVNNNGLFYIAEKNKSNNNTAQNKATYNNEYTCEGDNSILGSVNNPNTVAWLLQQILDYIKIIGPILVVVLSAIEFSKVIIQSDDEAMAKAKKKLVTRLILVACLFFIPLLVGVVLNIFGITSNATCGLK